MIGIKSLTLDLYSDSDSDSESEDVDIQNTDDQKLDLQPIAENISNSLYTSTKKRKQLNDMDDSDNDYILNDSTTIGEPPTKKQKLNDKKPPKQKKKVKQTKKKIVEYKFMNLKEKHRRL
eukprot:360826_1